MPYRMYNILMITERLFALQDIKYKDFQCKLMPTVDSDRVIGVRTPALRAMAKELYVTPEAEEFLITLPHTYYEEDNLHAFLLERIKDFDECITALDAFLPYIDNWATCDSLRPACLKKNAQRLLPHIERWLDSPHVYTVRFGIEALMLYFLDEHYDEVYSRRISRIRSDEYYVNMMIAWYFATALAKRWEDIIPFIKEKRLSHWVHNKVIGKACESYRITAEQKEYLRTLRI